MDISKVKAFDEIWFDCMGNLYISLLMHMDKKFRAISFNNDYKYYCRRVPTDSCELNILETYTSWRIIGDIFSERIPIEHDDDETFLLAIKEKMDKGYAVFVGLDLFYWIDENFCHNKEHWFHYTMVHSYDSEKNLFYVFDVSDDKKYGVFPISTENFLLAIRKGLEAGYYSSYCCINEKTKVQNLSINSFIENAKNRIDNLQEIKSAGYWEMPSIEYQKKAYESLNIVHLGRIVQRLMANENLFSDLCDKKILTDSQSVILEQMTEKLINGWSMIRTRLNMLYLKEFDGNEIKKLNIQLGSLFDLEISLWQLFINDLSSFDNDLVIYSFD